MCGYEMIPTREGSRPIKGWTRGVPVEDAAAEQLRNVASMPFIHSHVAVMAAQSDLVDIVHTLRQVVCVKG